MFEILLRVIYVFTSSAQKRLHSRYSQTVCLIKGKLSLDIRKANIFRMVLQPILQNKYGAM